MIAITDNHDDLESLLPPPAWAKPAPVTPEETEALLTVLRMAGFEGELLR